MRKPSEGTGGPQGRAQYLDDLATGYRETQILLAAVRLGLFAALGKRPTGATAEELAADLDADLRGVRILSDALAALELLEKDGERYKNGELARELLLPESAASKVPLLLHTAELYERWAGLYDAVKSGRPVPEEAIDPRLRRSAEGFARAMHVIGRESVRKVIEAVDLSAVRRLLDVGGGPATYAIEIARRHPNLRAVVFDRPETLEVARRRIRRAGLDDRVSTLAGDAFRDPLGGPYDFVLISNLIHIYSAAANRELIARCTAALSPGGRLCLKDFFMDPGGTSPAGGAIFAVNMLVATEAGDCYPTSEVEEWLAGAGLRFDELVELTPRSRLVLASRPG